MRRGAAHDRRIDGVVASLRKKIKPIEAEFDLIETLYGVGYRMKSG